MFDNEGPSVLKMRQLNKLLQFHVLKPSQEVSTVPELTSTNSLKMNFCQPNLVDQQCISN